MPDFLLAYHGGKMPETPEEGAAEMKKWTDWMGSLGAAMVAPGNPVGQSWTLSASGAEANGGANPVSGYSILSAADMAAAIELSKGCPQLAGGTIEIAQIIEM